MIQNEKESYRLEERKQTEINFDQTNEFLTQISNKREKLISALYGTVSNAIYIGVLNDLDRIRIQYIDGGTTNMCFHVWDARMDFPSRTSKKYNGIFVKVALLKPRWARQDAPICKLDRLDREGMMLNFLSRISPNSSSNSIMCCANDRVNDDKRYLVNEYFPDEYSELSEIQ